MSTIDQLRLDLKNADYWNEPCGTHLARQTRTEGNYKDFDAAYFKKYPFLKRYLDKFNGRILEIGTGYGTVASYLAERCQYVGLDIADGPLKILIDRGLSWWRGSALDIPLAGPFDGVVSIGCLHHTGDIEGALVEIHRILKPGGRSLVMLYNEEADRLPVDKNTKGEIAPHIEYTNVDDLGDLFWGWASYRYDVQNGANKDIYIEAAK